MPIRDAAELTLLCGFDDDLAGQINQTSNRIHSLLTHIHPALEPAVGPHLDHPAMLDLIERYPSPAQLASLSEKQLTNRLTKLAPRVGQAWAAQIVQALSEQTVVVLGTQAATIALPRIAQQLVALRRQRDDSPEKSSNECLLTLFALNSEGKRIARSTMPWLQIRYGAFVLAAREPL